MIRVRQKTGSYCGPAVFEMLVSGYGLNLDQEKMVDAANSRKTVMKVGIPLVDLARGLQVLYPNLVVWQKTESKLEDLKAFLEKDYLVGVDWQGIFTADEYGDDEEDKWGKFLNKMNKIPELKGAQGHYCVVLEINLKEGFLRFADPYGHYAGKDRFVATWEFEERWWDDRIDVGEKGRKIYVSENRLMFLVAKKGDRFPASLGMEKIISEGLADMEMYKEDERRSLIELWNKYLELEESGWEKELIAEQKLVLGGKEITFPIYAFKTPLRGGISTKAMWVLGGVHGEEPAGPNAFFEQLEIIKEMGDSGVPMIFIPLLNPSGYYRDFRYEDEYRDFRKGHSVTDSEHYLLQEGTNKPRVETPNSKTSGDITAWVEKMVSLYQPELVIDHHEDRVPEKFPEGDPRNLTSCYVYASGDGEHTKEIARMINNAFKETNLPVVDKGTTRFGEEIVGGAVMNAADGSIDEFLGVSEYYDPKTQTVKSKHPAATVIVVETTVPFDGSISLKQRVEAHGKTIKSYPEFWKMVTTKN